MTYSNPERTGDRARLPPVSTGVLDLASAPSLGGNVAGGFSVGGMTSAQQSEKLALIDRLALGEIEGWRSEITRHDGRPFNGEAAALAAREKQIKGGR